ncbi:hypothetical protein BH11PLA2_BH11PLA2_08890 [soil metagenome]
MNKIAIIVEPHFIERHVGVRNYTFALAALLKQHGRVDFVSFIRSDSGRTQWFKIALRDPAFAVNCGLTRDSSFTGSPSSVLEQYRESPTSAHTSQNDVCVYTHFGPNLAREGYDACVISNPWLLHLTEPIPIPRQFGVAYDAIPNRYTLTNANKPFAFAAEHAQGYDYFRRHCEATFAISESTRADLVGFFGLNAATTIALPPLLPVSYFDMTMPEVTREASIVLASPLDPRKGLEVLPDLINPLRADNVLHSIQMYGEPRCSPEVLNRFFDRLDSNLMLQWYPRATAATVQRMLASSRLCLFPSTSEGLGLPVLEAQMCGCRVLARDIDPINRNLLAGSILLNDDAQSVARQIRDAVTDTTFDHAALRTAAQQRFSTQHVDRVLDQTLQLSVTQRTYPRRRMAA